MQQFKDGDVISPLDTRKMTKEQKNQALLHLMFLKQKQDGSIKGRDCANGCKQHIWQKKLDISLPKVLTMALFLTSVIDALEERDVATADIPRFFLQTPADKNEQLFI